MQVCTRFLNLLFMSISYRGYPLLGALGKIESNLATIALGYGVVSDIAPLLERWAYISGLVLAYIDSLVLKPEAASTWPCIIPLHCRPFTPRGTLSCVLSKSELLISPPQPVSPNLPGFGR